MSSLLDSMANTGMVELGEVQLATYLAEKIYTKQPSFQNGVKVIFFSETGERAAPFVRQAALNYWPYAAFAFVPWREEESSLWWNGLENVYRHVTHDNKKVLPQLRSVTPMKLGLIQEALSTVDKDQSLSLAAVALKEKRLTFTWLDGEAQQ
ncbi:unnamed protein product [Camellia sinensis]